MEHSMRQTVIALRIADRLGVDEQDRVATYYTGLLANVYCHADAYEQARWFGDDIALKHGVYEPDLFTLVRMIGSGQRGFARARTVAAFPVEGVRFMNGILERHSALASQFAERIGLDERSCTALPCRPC